MKFNSEEICSLINKQHKLIVNLLATHGSSAILTTSILDLSYSGKESPVIQLALIDDCLNAIESILFSPTVSRRSDRHELHAFLKPIARIYAKKDPTVYLSYRNLAPLDCEDFLESHYTDCRPFGGANRRTKWSGFQIVRNADVLLGGAGLKETYRSMIELVTKPLLNEAESIMDVLELGGLWSALVAENTQVRDSLVDFTSTKQRLNHDNIKLVVSDFGNAAVLFDVVANRDGTTSARINSAHMLFKQRYPLASLLQAWARMESLAWDNRKQILEDIRSDLGRVSRDLIEELSKADNE
jgi:hypothetical protein